MKLTDRIRKLEAKHRPEIRVEFTPDELSFIADIRQRLQQTGCTSYYDVCSGEEFDRIKSLSFKQAHYIVRNSLKNEIAG